MYYVCIMYLGENVLPWKHIEVKAQLFRVGSLFLLFLLLRVLQAN